MRTSESRSARETASWRCSTRWLKRWLFSDTRRGDLVAIIIMVLVVTGSFWNVIRDPVRIIQEDLAFEWEGMHTVANEQIRQGMFPHWDPYGLGGQRLYANVLLALFYPGSVLFRLISFPIACLLTWILHYIATALITYALARIILKVCPPAAFLSGIIFALGGFCLGHCNHLSFVYALPWFVLLLLASYQFASLQGRSAWLWWLVGLACMSFMILSGGTPVLLLALVALAWLIGTMILCDLYYQRFRAIMRLLIGVGAMGIFALGLSAFQLMPTMDLFAVSTRSGWATEKLLAGGIQWRTLLCQLVAPGVLGNQTTGSWHQFYHEISVFVGGVALTFAVMGLLAIRRHTWVIPLIALLLLSVVLSLGDIPVLRALHALIPILRMRQPSRYVALVQLAVALLAGIGMHYWLTDVGRVRHRLSQVVCLTVLLLMSISTLWILHWLSSAGISPESFGRWVASQSASVQAWVKDASPHAVVNVTAKRSILLTVSFIIWCGSGLVVCVCTWLKAHWRKTAVGLVCAWAGLELLLFGIGTSAGQDRFPGITNRPPPIVEFLKKNLGNDRYFNAAVYLPLWEDRGGIYGLPNLDGYVGSGLNISREHNALFRRMHGWHVDLGLFSTKYILLREDRYPGPLKPVFRDAGIIVYENPHRVPRVTFLTSVRSVSDVETAIQLMGNPEFDPHRIGFLTGITWHHEYSAPAPNCSEYCRIARWDPGHIIIESECEVPRWIFISTSFDKGWQASINGNSASLIRTNACFISTKVPSGRHILELTYETPQLKAGIAVTFVTLILLVVAAGFRFMLPRGHAYAISP